MYSAYDFIIFQVSQSLFFLEPFSSIEEIIIDHFLMCFTSFTSQLAAPYTLLVQLPESWYSQWNLWTLCHREFSFLFLLIPFPKILYLLSHSFPETSKLFRDRLNLLGHLVVVLLFIFLIKDSVIWLVRPRGIFVAAAVCEAGSDGEFLHVKVAFQKVQFALFRHGNAGLVFLPVKMDARVDGEMYWKILKSGSNYWNGHWKL